MLKSDQIREIPRFYYLKLHSLGKIQKREQKDAVQKKKNEFTEKQAFSDYYVRNSDQHPDQFLAVFCYDFLCRKKSDTEIDAVFPASDQYKPGSGVHEACKHYAEFRTAGKHRKSSDRMSEAK